MRASIEDGDHRAIFQASKNTITLGDGYVFQREESSSSTTEAVETLRAIAPDGREATAFIHLNKTTGQHFATGIDTIRQLVSGSSDFYTLAGALPAIAAAISAENGTALSVGHHVAGHRLSVAPNALTTVSQDFWGCAFVVVLDVLETIAFIGACGIPEPVEPIVCAAALITWVAAGYTVADSCS